MKQYFLQILFLLSYWNCFSSNTPVTLQKINGPIKLDGISDEKPWLDIKPLPLVQHLPNFGSEPSENSEILIGYDEEFIYVAGRLYDSAPDKIAASTKKRDAMVGNTDWFGVVLDSYNDKENALAFCTNPEGLRFDGSVFNDAIGTMPVNVSWNTFWDVATVITDEGWFVEMRIPFTSLNFQNINGKIVMGLISWRWIARKTESSIFPAIPPNWGAFSSWKPSMAQEVNFEGIKRKKPVYLAPYVLTGINNFTELNEAETHYDTDTDFKFEPGLDLKYGLTNNLTLDLSVNTDFAQVEADDQQVNLTRSNIFFPEKRLFFQERSGVFDFSYGRMDKLFYSRRIGIQDGTPIRIYGGARLIGRVGTWDMGLINMQTAHTNELNGENFGVLRIKRNVLNPNSTVGAIMTSKIGSDSNYVAVYGLDATLKLGKENYLSLRWSQSFENDKANNPISLDPTKFWISLVTRNTFKFNYGVSLSRAGMDFNPSMGFQERDNYSRWGHRVAYGFATKSNAPVLRHGPLYRGVYFYSNEFQKFTSYNSSLKYELALKNGFTGELGLGLNYENLFEQFELPLDEAAIIPIGKYEFYHLEGMLLTPPSIPLYSIIQFRIGEYYDGIINSITFNPIYNPSSSWELGGTYQFNRVKFPDRGLEFNAHLVRLKVLYMFNTKLSISSFIQYSSAEKLFIGNFRLRFNPREGNDFYIVYNENLNSDLERETPFLPQSEARTILLKYTYTFRL